jgi:hypothetical protein
MAFTDTITLQDATPADQAYDVIRRASSSTTRRVAGLPLDEPKELTISHNVDAKGAKVSTLVGIKRAVKDVDEVTIGSLTAQLTLRYDTGQITAAMIQEDVAELVEFCSVANVVKLLNQEH